MMLRLGKRIAAICLVAVMLVGGYLAKAPFGAVKVYAATDRESSLSLGAAVLEAGTNTTNAATVWYGYEKSGNDTNYKWRVVGYDGKAQNNLLSVSGVMTLLADGLMSLSEYDSTYPYSNNYDGSDLKTKIEGIASNQTLTLAELSAIQPRTLKGGSANSNEIGYDDNLIRGNDVTDAAMWPLSVAEANNLNEGLKRLDNDFHGYAWWLRSPGSFTSEAEYVDDDSQGSYDVNHGFGVRPAFYLDLSSVIFSSLISRTAGESVAEYKLIVKDKDMVLNIGAGGATWNDDNTITVPYVISGTKADSATQISVVMTNGFWTGKGWSEGAKIKYYGKVSSGLGLPAAVNDEVTGSVSISLPNGYNPSWNIYILAEKVNDFNNDTTKKYTDYASAPVSLKPVKTLGAGMLEGKTNTSDAATVWYGYNENNTENKDKYKWRVVGYDGKENDALNETGMVTLLAAGSIRDNVQFNPDTKRVNSYSESNLQSVVNDISGKLSDIEKAAVGKRNLEGQNVFYGESGFDKNKIFGNNVNDAVMWPLSTGEADVLNQDLRSIGSYWWLRSPGDDSDFAAGVSHGGYVSASGSGVDLFGYGVRPAFYLNLSSVIFSSLISGRAGESDAEYKLTVKDGDMVLNIGESGATLNNDNTYTVPYVISGDNAGSATQISVVMTNGDWIGTRWSEDAEIKLYKKLNTEPLPVVDGEGKRTGSVSITLSDDYNIYLIAEKVNDFSNDTTRKYTDYASAPIRVVINKPPHFIDADKTVLAVSENTTRARAGQIRAEDKENDSFTFEITGGNAQDLFDIALTTGVVTMKNGVEPFDYESWVDSGVKYKIKVEVSDARALSFNPELCTQGTFEVKVTDLNESPYFNYSPTDTKEISIAEDAIFSDEKVKIADLDTHAVDDSFINNEVIAVGGDTDIFDVTSSGQVFVKTGKTLDYETKDTYTLDLRVRDANKDTEGNFIYPDLYADMTFTVKVRDVTEYSEVSTAPSGASGLTYDGTEHALLASPGAASYGTIKYAVKTDDSTPADSEYTYTDPSTVKGKDAGIYKVWYKSFGNTNFYDSDADKVEVTVSKRPVKVTGGITANNKEYDGNATADLNTASAVFDGLLGSDSGKVTVSATGTFTDVNAGVNKTVTISDITLSGTAKDNYEIATSGNQTTATADITKATASVTKEPEAADLTYTGSAQALVTSGTAEGGDMVYALATCKGVPEEGAFTSAIPTGTDAGDYYVWYKIVGDANHNDSVPDRIAAQISRKAVTVTAENVEKTAGEADPELKAVAEGLVGTDKVVYTVSRAAGEKAGTYAITPAGEAQQGNYIISFAEGTFTIREASVPGPVIYNTSDPTPTVTPEPDPDNYTKTIKNSDGSTTTRTVAKNEDGSTTTTEKTVYPGGKTIDTTTVKQEDGSFTTLSETTDASGNVISTTSIVSSIDTAGVTTRTTDTYNADGTSLNSILKTSASREVLYSYVKEVKLDRKGNTVVTSDTKNEDGTKVSKVYKSRGNHGDGVKVSKFQSDKGKVTIPANITVAGHKVKVTAIAGGAFKNDLTLTKVKIGKNVTVIGKNAFKGCKNLKSITITGNLTEVHAGAFKGIAPDAVISIKADKENFDRIVAMIKASGISKTVKFKRVK